MDILLVDDQQTVIDGLLVGIHWEQLKISNVYQANNMEQAQEIIETHNIDLMLCDIEMPFGNGLELYEWVLEHDFPIKCIFLTAHEDFHYIKKAIYLQGFDYLLQPVPYSEIEEVLKKALEKIQVERIKDDYFVYAKEAKNKEYLMRSQMLRDYLLEFNKEASTLLKNSTMLFAEIDETTKCRSALLQIFSCEEEEKWNQDLLLYVLDNVATEMFEEMADTVMVVALDRTYYYIILYTKESIQQGELERAWEKIFLFLQERFKMKVAIYEGDVAEFAQLPQIYQQLMNVSYENVMNECKFMESATIRIEENVYESPNYQSWDSMIKDGCYDVVVQEALMCIQQQVASGQINQMFLKRFHQDYIGWFFYLLRKGRAEGLFLESSESEQYNYESMMNSYTSVERMKSLIVFTIEYLKSVGGTTDILENRIEEIREYIHNNMEKNISRKELADAVYLNPEYLSRYFKKEMGCTLSEFILKEKMKTAKALLENTKFSVSVIASKIGYSNFSYFAQCFKKEFGVSPSEYRLHKEEIE